MISGCGNTVRPSRLSLLKIIKNAKQNRRKNYSKAPKEGRGDIQVLDRKRK